MGTGQFPAPVYPNLLFCANDIIYFEIANVQSPTPYPAIIEVVMHGLQLIDGPIDNFVHDILWASNPYRKGDYANRAGLGSFLEQINNTDQWVWSMQGYPNGTYADTAFSARETREFTLSAPRGTWVTGIGAYINLNGAMQVSIFNKATNHFIVNRETINSRLLCTGTPMVGSTSGGVDVPLDAPIGLYRITPILITTPNQLQVTLTNTNPDGGTTERAQVTFELAIPNIGGQL
jgi:hypothetical protein